MGGTAGAISPDMLLRSARRNSPSRESNQDQLDAAIHQLTPALQAAAEANSPPAAAAASSSSSDAAAAAAAAAAAQKEQEDMEASIALARQLMYEESMQAAHWIQQETLAAHRQMALERANQGIEDGGADDDLMYALELAEQEQHAAEHHVGDDEEFDVEEMSYDQLMNLGSRIGDVAQQRWQLDGKRVIKALPTHELTEAMLAERAQAKTGIKSSSLALVVDASEPAETVRAKVEDIAAGVGKEKFEVDPVQIFDLFEGKGLPDGKKSLALTFRFRAPDRTLGEKELNQAFEDVIAGIRSETSYELRS